ncbi:MAG: flippase-like domain-containing protein [candidate division KSB1 bacterium]|nr:flippase-like domain-containing protein [candidate division KSB1 bacterium]MDZ7295444.1 flippase-like domain-containing protein [candidate division KSB1 bacterium]MDZ7384759.1 flippase-like domain-containing protein [candidate division KSB1 bacterium]MDZ7391276.1 flippase-like domain-containing protein [candidate division KSB1 bacterium]MDZ7412001.1 flippase-like domain-containing protein [candidate division KSB1 bacterium]
MKGGAVAQEDEARRARRRLVLLALRAAVSLLLIGLLFLRANVREIWSAMRQAEAGPLAAAFALLFVGYIISTLRWQFLLRALEIHLPFRSLLASYCVAIFVGNFLPSTVGGDAVRAYDTVRLSGRKGAPIAAVLVDRLLGVLALVLFAALVVVGGAKGEVALPWLRVGILLGLVAVVALVVWIFAGRKEAGGEVDPPLSGAQRGLAGLARRSIAAFRAFGGKTSALGMGIGYSLLLQANVVLHFYLIAKAVGINLGIGHFFFVVPVATLLTMLPISINGIGIRENAFVFLLSPFGVPPSTTIAFTWIGFGMILLYGAMGGVVYALRR